jgi:hypothetical protein
VKKATPVDIEEPAILIRIRQLWEPGMSDEDLYDATRAYWKVGRRREGAELGIAVADSIVRAVYSIDSWHRAGTSGRTSRIHSAAPADRWEFIGRLAESLQSKYVGHSVAHYFRHGNQNPILYVNC